MSQYKREPEDPFESFNAAVECINENINSLAGAAIDLRSTVSGTAIPSMVLYRNGVPDWENYFIEVARVVASRSRDGSTQVGAVITNSIPHIVATGYNGLPSHLAHKHERYERPHKYLYIEHAERNAIYAAARGGVSLEGGRLFLWASSPLGVCADCARAIIQSGIRYVWAYNPIPNRQNLGESISVGMEMLKEAGIILTLR